jgi:amidohydrolase
MAVLIGTLKVLDGLSDRFNGSVRFVFQPAEEEAGGGRMMVDRGLLDAEPKPSAVFALHGWPGIPAGAIAATPGPAMAAQDRFRITVKGRGGHGAVPHKTIDPVVTGAQIVGGLQTVVSRSLEPVAAGVISVCTIHGGTTSNVIPDEVVMEGTTRYFDNKVQSLIRTRMEEVVRGICTSAGAGYLFDYNEGYIPLVNDPGKVSFLRTVVESYLGETAWIPDLPQSMGAEDFAFYLARVPGVFLRLGLGEDSPGLHSGAFDFNDESIEAGITVMSALALETLAQAAS